MNGNEFELKRRAKKNMEIAKKTSDNKKKIGFTQVSNHAIKNPKLSLKAKGLYSMIKSLMTIKNYNLHKTTLQNQCPEGKTAFEGAWKELKSKGYLLQQRGQDTKTKKFYYDYKLLEEPIKEKKIMSKTRKDIHTPKNRGTENPDNGKEGYLINIVSNNNDGSEGIKTHSSKNHMEQKTKKEYNKDVLEAMQYYIDELYPQQKRKKHENLTYKQKDKIHDNINDFAQENGLSCDEIIELMEKFIENDTIKTDYNILHFATPGIMKHRYHEVFGTYTHDEEINL